MLWLVSRPRPNVSQTDHKYQRTEEADDAIIRAEFIFCRCSTARFTHASAEHSLLRIRNSTGFKL